MRDFINDKTSRSGFTNDKRSKSPSLLTPKTNTKRVLEP
jgi:hypothetical protein